MERYGARRIRRLHCPMIWLQERVDSGEIRTEKRKGEHNTADIGTKAVNARQGGLLCKAHSFQTARVDLIIDIWFMHCTSVAVFLTMTTEKHIDVTNIKSRKKKILISHMRNEQNEI